MREGGPHCGGGALHGEVVFERKSSRFDIVEIIWTVSGAKI